MKINNWKEYWLERQEDQARKRETRKEKKKIRRHHHKNKRKRVKEWLNSWDDYEEIEEEIK